MEKCFNLRAVVAPMCFSALISTLCVSSLTCTEAVSNGAGLHKRKLVLRASTTDPETEGVVETKSLASINGRLSVLRAMPSFPYMKYLMRKDRGKWKINVGDHWLPKQSYSSKDYLDGTYFVDVGGVLYRHTLGKRVAVGVTVFRTSEGEVVNPILDLTQQERATVASVVLKHWDHKTARSLKAIGLQNNRRMCLTIDFNMPWSSNDIDDKPVPLLPDARCLFMKFNYGSSALVKRSIVRNRNLRMFVAVSHSDEGRNRKTFDVRLLKQHHHLKVLCLHGVAIKHIQALSRMKSLHGLSLQRSKGVNNIASVFTLPDLRAVDVSRTDLDPRDLELRGGEEYKIEHLDISGTSIKKAEPFCRLKNLISLSASRTRITDLSRLVCLKKLKYVNLNASRVRDLSGLNNMNIKMISLIGTTIDGRTISRRQLHCRSECKIVSHWRDQMKEWGGEDAKAVIWSRGFVEQHFSWLNIEPTVKDRRWVKTMIELLHGRYSVRSLSGCMKFHNICVLNGGSLNGCLSVASSSCSSLTFWHVAGTVFLHQKSKAALKRLLSELMNRRKVNEKK